MRKLILILCIFGLTTMCFAQETITNAKRDNLIVYGENFSFCMKEPHGWIGDINNAAKYQANIVFYVNKSELDNGGALIQRSVFSKRDDNTIEDLNYDVNSYKKEYKKLKEQNLETKHSSYTTYSKLVFVENEFYQYITYINPGSKYKNGISVAMNISKRKATDKELEAYQQIIASLIMLK